MLTKLKSLSEKRQRPSRAVRGANELSCWLQDIRVAEHAAEQLTDTQIRSRADALREEFDEDQNQKHLAEFGGLVCESIFRCHGFRLHDVQVKAIAAAATGAIVEMQTGEGKTIVTGSIAAIQTLVAPTVHVGTTNTYLAERDREELVEVFERLGIRSGLLPEEPNEAESRRVYRNQVVYGPGYQYGFDYLRDQMHLRENRQTTLGVTTLNRIRGLDPNKKLIQPGEHHIALIDEADSVMIDEAMTPLVISLPAQATEDPVPYLLAHKIASEFVEGIEYQVELPSKKIDITDAANRQAHDEIANKHDLKLNRPWRVYISNAVRAIHVFQRNIDYVVVEGEVQIVDQNTGRIFSDRTWQDGLHQAVEAKEGVPIQPGRESTTQITRQRYLQMYDHLAGLTGTAASVTQEFQTIYGCNVIPIPTNKKSRRKILIPRFFASLEAKLAAIADEVVTRHATGQPILVGTKTIRESIEINEVLIARGLRPTVLNGVQDEEEAEIVSRAGATSAITIATNMAGRGTNIKLETASLEAGGLHVIGVSPNSSTRIDRQLVGRAARQGQPGSAQFFAAATDAIFVENKSNLTRQIENRARANGEAGDYSKELLALQTSIELRNYKMRQDMILRDKWMDSVREAIEKE